MLSSLHRSLNLIPFLSLVCFLPSPSLAPSTDTPLREHEGDLHKNNLLLKEIAQNDLPVKIFHSTNPFVWRLCEGRHTSLYSAHATVSYPKIHDILVQQLILDHTLLMQEPKKSLSRPYTNEALDTEQPRNYVPGIQHSQELYQS
jgi:hypothetical protein